MELSDVFGALGIVVSVLFGAWGIYLALKSAKNKASLSFVYEQVIGLFDDVTSKIPNLSITYKENQIDSKVILINGYLANDGGKDISPSMIEKKLTAILPDNWKWLECKVLSKPNDLNITSNVVSENELCFDFGLFRKGESFSFQALFSIDGDINDKKTKALIDNISWNHRIADLGKVKFIDLPYAKKTLRGYILPVAISLAYMGFSFYMLLSGMFERPIINYMAPINGEYVEVKFKPELDGNAELEVIETEHIETVNLEKYFKTTKIYPKISVPKGSVYAKYILFSLMFLSSFLMLYVAFEKDIKKRSIRKLITASNKT
ncbi:hypothetical protein [Pseudoalteromonas fuliginea]|uniref:hypothetical protein n=1 Tax=Pseudoalteromonas fuliginea TaxID=1872678 RepID=UPI00103D470E|nr:hypothetical protein [Pseudoalteromonas fuliginea]